MGKILNILIVLFIFCIILLNLGCTASDDGTYGNSDNIVTKVQKKTKVEVRVELESIVCNAAQKGGTCGTKLASLGLISESDCCSSYEVCCR